MTTRVLDVCRFLRVCGKGFRRFRVQVSNTLDVQLVTDSLSCLACLHFQAEFPNIGIPQVPSDSASLFSMAILGNHFSGICRAVATQVLEASMVAADEAQVPN